MGAENQETARDALATLLATALVGTGKPVQAVYNYKKGKFSGSPVVLVSSGSTRRKQAGMGSQKFHNWFGLLVWIFVADADAASSWTEQDVDDKLDEIDADIADVVAANRKNANWDYLAHSDEPSTEPGGIIIDGNEYLFKVIRLVAEVTDA